MNWPPGRGFLANQESRHIVGLLQKEHTQSDPFIRDHPDCPLLSSYFRGFVIDSQPQDGLAL
jgi:hypothetical protein